MTLVPTDAALKISDLRITVPHGTNTVDGVSEVSLTLRRGQRLGIVGESGSGKSLTMRAVVGLLGSRTTAAGGTIEYFGKQLPSQPEIQKVCSIVFQDALSALNPTRRVGDIVADGAQLSGRLTRRQARQRALELMSEVGIPDPEHRFRMFPHELSGGLRQRVMIAAALSTNPQVLVCDEPTTALDVTIQKQIIELLARLVRERHMSLIFVSHDLGVVDVLCDRIAVFYAGQVVETGPTAEVLGSPRHPYTRALLDATLPVTHRVQFRPIPGAVPDPVDSVDGCRFAARCVHSRPACTTATPRIAEADQRATACIRAEELVAGRIL